jgi:hypothetical protein
MTRRILIASGCNEPYYPQMRAFMESVQRYKGPAEAFLVGAAWQPPDALGFRGVHLPLDLTAGHGGTWCVQHGGFLHALPAEDDDVVIFSDGGDVVMQRTFTEDELESFYGLDQKTVMVGWNAGPGDTLRAEVPRIHPKGPTPTLFDLDLPCYNTGLVVATTKAYRQLYESYMVRWHKVAPYFEHYAKQQWIMSGVLGSVPKLNPKLLPGSVHTHGHHGTPPGVHFDEDGVLYYEGQVVLFRHRI